LNYFQSFQSPVNRVEKINADNSQRTAYIRDANGNIMATYAFNSAGQWTWSDQHLYGAERLGVIDIPEGVVCDDESTTTTTTNAETGYIELDGRPNTNPLHHYHHFAGSRRYEITNHLGNVMVVINDLPIIDASLGFQTADVVSATDYYPFGLEMVGRTYSASEYAFGFNGKINDEEILSNGRWQDYGFRAYRSDIGRFVSVDPLKGAYPWYSPYQFAGNMPIWAIDLDGKEGIPGALWGFVGELAIQAIQGEGYSLSKIALSTAQGFISPQANAVRSVKLMRVVAVAALEYVKAASEYDPNKHKGSQLSYVLREGSQNVVGAFVGAQAVKAAKSAIAAKGGVDAIGHARDVARKTGNIAKSGGPRVAQTQRAAEAQEQLQKAKNWGKIDAINNDDYSSIQGHYSTTEEYVQNKVNDGLSIYMEPADDTSDATVQRPETITYYNKTLKRNLTATWQPDTNRYQTQWNSTIQLKPEGQ
jgi:RHS repeat-associated protein